MKELLTPTAVQIRSDSHNNCSTFEYHKSMQTKNCVDVANNATWSVPGSLVYDFTSPVWLHHVCPEL